MLVQLAEPALMIVAAEFAPLAARLREVAPDAQVLELGREGSLEWQLARCRRRRHRTVSRSRRSAAGDPAVHLGHDRPAQGRDGDFRQCRRHGSQLLAVGARRCRQRVPVRHADVPRRRPVLGDQHDPAGRRHVADLLAVRGRTKPSSRLADPALGVTHYFCVPQMAKQLREHAAFDARGTFAASRRCRPAAHRIPPRLCGRGSTTAFVASTDTG